MQAYEAMRWALQRINQDSGVLQGNYITDSYIPGVKIGKLSYQWLQTKKVIRHKAYNQGIVRSNSRPPVICLMYITYKSLKSLQNIKRLHVSFQLSKKICRMNSSQIFFIELFECQCFRVVGRRHVLQVSGSIPCHHDVISRNHIYKPEL